MDEKSLNRKKIIDTLRERIEPHKRGVSIKVIREIKGDGVCLRVGSHKDGQTLKKAVKADPKLVTKTTGRVSEGRRPKIIMLHVPNYIKDEEITRTLFEQNQIWMEMTKEGFKEQCKITTTLTRGKMRENCQHVILSVTPRIRNIFIKERYLALAWSHVKVDDFILVLHCFKCCGFRHFAHECGSKLRCSHCTKEHKFSDCSGKDFKPVCINCTISNKNLPMGKRYNTQHNAYDPICPTTQKIKTNIKKVTNYGY
ncbi:uncharacterized protein LOC111614941 [Centruroides sculpturatus]|uniref:uncharacterized protein LOC111614941 n=1 Tax=Centruroides sculpturatus TaxID=218467 RepID=UPI000C6EAC18|nr:uncharacterized protein LOC111614941 [Centruroides sculpturatus]